VLCLQVFVEQCRELDIAIAASSAGAASMARQTMLRRQAAAAAAAAATAGEDGSGRPPLGASAASLASVQVSATPEFAHAQVLLVLPHPWVWSDQGFAQSPTLQFRTRGECC
jgi:hypothetical protein